MGVNMMTTISDSNKELLSKLPLCQKIQYELVKKGFDVHLTIHRSHEPVTKELTDNLLIAMDVYGPDGFQYEILIIKYEEYEELELWVDALQREKTFNECPLQEITWYMQDKAEEMESYDDHSRPSDAYFSEFNEGFEQAQMLLEQYEHRERRFWKTGKWSTK